MFSIREVKRSARATIKASLGSVLLVSFVYALIIELLQFLDMKVLYGSFDYMGFLKELMAAETLDAELLSKVPVTNSFARLISQAIAIMSGILAAGFTYYSLLISRRAKAGLGDMFDIFGIFFRALGMLLLQAVYVMLWSLLFIIPGIIAAYRYSMAIYIMLDRPDISVVDCIRMSKEMTYGNKGKLFALDMSFIVWFIVIYAVNFLAFENQLLSIVISLIISVFFTPYYNVTMSNVYNRLSGYRGDVEAECSESPAEESFDASNWYDN